MKHEDGVNNQPASPRVKLVEVQQVPSIGEEPRIYGPQDAASIARGLLENKDREHFLVLHINAEQRVASCEVAAVGLLNSAQVHPREIFKGAFLANAAAIICAHNHPSGSLEPSKADRSVFDILKQSGELLGVALLDFLIVSSQGSWSAREHWPL